MTQPHDEPLSDMLRENAEIHAILQTQAEANLTHLHRPIEHFARLLSHPAFILTVLALFVAWIVLNLDLKFVTSAPWDEPPFFWLQGLVSLLGLITTATVLVSQSRQAQMAEQRAQLQLQMVLLTEQRSTKMIALLEELRRDLPNVRDRYDPEAEALKHASQPETVLEVIQRFNAEAEEQEQNAENQAAGGADTEPLPARR